jgi:hypothetical protein
MLKNAKSMGFSKRTGPNPFPRKTMGQKLGTIEDKRKRELNRYPTVGGNKKDLVGRGEY